MTSFGRDLYESTNAFLNESLGRHPFSIAAHRGAPRGDIKENTLASVVATKAVGAEIAEIDIIRSTDGEYFAFHDGFELSRLGDVGSLLDKTGEEIAAIRYSDYPDTYYGHVESAAHILNGTPRIVVNIDRSWRYWNSGFLDWLDGLHMEDRLLLKCPSDEEFLTALAEHEVKYMFMGMISQPDDLKLFVDDERINTVGVELVAPKPETPFTDSSIFETLHQRNLFAFVNALDLGNGYCGLHGYDDTVSILEGPQHGWGKLLALGADIIQTDWPEMLDAYRRQVA